MINTQFNTKFFNTLPLLIFIFNPKIDIINVPGYWQGIRLDDLVILFYSLFFVYKNNFYLPKLINHKTTGLNFIIFFPYLFLSIFVGKIFNIPVAWIIPVRYLEYIFLIIILNQLKFDKNDFILLIKVFIFVNLIISFFQYFELLGAITPRGFSPNNLTNPQLSNLPANNQEVNTFFSTFRNVYSPAGGLVNKRLYGLLGGPWELATLLSISIFILINHYKDLGKIHLYFISSTLMIVLTQSRGIIFAYFVSLIFILKNKKQILTFIFLFFFTLGISYYFNLFGTKNFIDNKILINYFEILKLLFYSFSPTAFPSQTDYIGTGLESFWIRAEAWYNHIDIIKSSVYLQIFGSGTSGNSIYTESLIVRVITSFGLFGSILIIFLSRNLPRYFLIFLIISGITLDLFISFKIFTFSILLLIFLKHKDNPNENFIINDKRFNNKNSETDKSKKNSPIIKNKQLNNNKQCLCGSSRAKLVSKFDRENNPIDLVICTDCGLLRQKNIQLNLNFREFYKNHYREIKKNTPEKLYELTFDRSRRVFNNIKNYTPNIIKKNLKILDYGGGAGGVLDQFKKLTNKLYLYDLNSKYKNFLNKKGIKFIDNVKNLKSKPDIIILSHVIEHWNEFDLEIKKIIKLQKKNTINYISIPSINRLMRGHRDGDFFYEIQLPHIYYFSSETLESILGKYGFKKIFLNDETESIFIYDGQKRKVKNNYKIVKEYLINSSNLILYFKFLNFLKRVPLVRLTYKKIFSR